MSRFSVLLRAAALGLFSTILVAASSVAAGPSQRERLVESKAFSAVYAIDEHQTVAAVAPGGDGYGRAREGFKALCEGSGAVLAREDHGTDGESYACGSSFTASAAPGSVDGARSFIVRHAESQPLAYRTPVVPSYASLLEPAKGKLKESYSSAEIYQYVYALCKKENGNPAFVVPRRYGKYVRLTKVAPADAFEYLITSVEKKDAWYAACEGKKRFMLEKEYAYSEGAQASIIFHPNRGLEGISFVSSDEAPSLKSKLEAAVTDEDMNNPNKIDFLDEMAWEVAFTRTDFVKTLDGGKYFGLYDTAGQSCKRVTIVQKDGSPANLSKKRAYVYKVCADPDRKKPLVVIPVSGIQLASVYGK